MLIRYSDGHLERGMLIGASTGAMRVAFSPERASVMFTRSGGQWSSEERGPAEVDFTADGTLREWHGFCELLIGLDEEAPWDADSLLAVCVPVARPEARA